MRTPAPVATDTTRSQAPRRRVEHAAEARSKWPGMLAPTCVETTGGADYSSVPLHAQARAEAVRPAREAEDERAVDVPPIEIIPKDRDEFRPPKASLAAPGTHAIVTVLKKGRAPETFPASGAVPLVRSHYQNAAPSGAPATGNGSNDCTPAASTVSFNVVEADANNWRVDVQSMTLAGTVNVKPWPSNPTNPATPNTANPVDGGNITAGNFQSAIDDMADYNLPGGGAGPNWHSTGASSAHEWAHWNTDWIADSVSTVAGGNWAKANQDLDALTQPKATSATAADARTALQGRVNTRVATFNNAAVTRWNAIPDTPGVAGSTGYIAGAAVLATLISAVRNYAITKGWAAPPPAPGPAPPPAPGP